ncbi:RNase H family protein [Bradyrhizobium sp. DASA03076]|uniref:RNase H family protein n=1 Tax=Bradyrhizobium sp. BLXBL-03 TaxID=3395916 RepID=UPI003F6F0A63
MFDEPGPAGFAWELQDNGEIIDRDAEPIDSYSSSENEAYAVGVFRILEAAPDHSAVHIITTADYVAKTITTYMPSWIKNGWKNTQGKDPAYVEWWKRSHEQCTQRNITATSARYSKNHPDYKETFKLLDLIAVTVRQHRGGELGSPRGAFGPIDPQDQ